MVLKYCVLRDGLAIRNMEKGDMAMKKILVMLLALIMVLGCVSAMAEEIDVVDGRVYIMTESASAKYRFGILTGGRWCHSLAID